MVMTIREKFILFHKANPDIYDLFERFTFEAIAAGMTKLGAKFVFERIRWEVAVTTVGAGYCVATKRPFKLSNNFTAYYSRLFMARNRSHKVFNVRPIKS
jgi:hypothetical protein